MNFFEEEATSRRAALRKKARACRDGMPEAARLAASRVICANFLNLPETERAGSFFVYAAFRSEVATAELMAALLGMGKVVCAPLVMLETKDMLPIQMDAPFCHPEERSDEGSPTGCCGIQLEIDFPASLESRCAQDDGNKPPVLAPGFQGIPEPVFHPDRVFAPEALDVVVLPGLLFDRNGNRLGYGGGYYDRFLATQAPQALRVGLAFARQLADAPIPAEPHDMRLDMLVTEAEILRFPG